MASLVGSPEDEPSRPSLRLRVLGIVVVVLFLVLILRLWTLQVIDGKSYAAAVTANQVRIVSVEAPRGVIVDRNDTVLAGNVDQEEILLSRATAQEDPGIEGLVASLVGQSPAQVKAEIADSQNSPFEPVPIDTDATPAMTEYLQEHESEFPGVTEQQVSERAYPQNTATQFVATPVLGYVSPISATELKDNPTGGYTEASQFGQSGLENQYEKYLRGTPGVEALSVNAQGQEVGVLRHTDPVQGDTVVSNIDLGLQEYVQQVLQQTLKTDRNTIDPDTHRYPTANDGAAVVLNAQTGAVLAMASSPTYNLAEWVGGISTANYNALSANCNTLSTTTGCPLINYAIDGEYTPGSTFKLNTATAALDDGIISAGTYVDDTGVYHVPQTCTEGCTYTDDEDESAGEVNVVGALTQSDDYYFYQLGDEFYYSNESRSGFRTPPPTTGWASQPGSTCRVKTLVRSTAQPFGRHSTRRTRRASRSRSTTPAKTSRRPSVRVRRLVTPIQQAVAYATFANGGTRYQPRGGGGHRQSDRAKSSRRSLRWSPGT